MRYYRAMKISNLGSSKGPAPAKRKKKAAGKGRAFAERLKEAAAVAEVHGGVEPSTVTAVNSVLSVQESSDATDHPSRTIAKQYGSEILDRLDELRKDILFGAVPKDKLAGIARKMRAKRQESDDPKLNAIIDEIELRAEVEIAKLTRNV